MLSKLFNPDHLKHLCSKYGLKPSKKYGQNFLLDVEPIEKMIEAAGIKKTDTIIEIGPGFGVLTFALAAKAKKVISFEIEKKLIPYWETHRPDNVEIIWGNILRNLGTVNCELGTGNCGELGTVNRELGTYKVVSNLPYQITSAVIRAFLESDNPPESMTLMVQKEVAERICAKAACPAGDGSRGRGDMSLLSVAVQYYAEPKIVAIVPRDNFWPEPQVDSAVIKIVHSPPAGEAGSRRAVHSVSEKEIFFRVVKAGFANRRKLLIKNLEPLFSACHSEPDVRSGEESLRSIFSKLGLKPTVRAQELGVEEWKALADQIINYKL